MTSTKQIHNFIRAVLSQQQINLDVYADKSFCGYLHSVCIEDISFILFKISTVQLLAEQNSRDFDLPNIINTAHPATGFTLLDYCLVAGFADLALHLAFCGARSSHIDVLRNKFARCDSDDSCPDVALEIRDTLRHLSHINPGGQLVVADKKPEQSYFQQAKQFCSEHKSPVFLLTLGVTCSLLSPIIHGAGSILLLSVGIPSMLSSVGAYQNSRGGRDNREFLEAQKHADYSIEEVKRLIKIVNQAKYAIKRQLSNNEVRVIVNNAAITERGGVSSAPMMFKFNSLEDANSLVENPANRESSIYRL